MAGKRLAIIGSRKFKTLADVARFVHRLKATTTVVSGGAKGVDTAAVVAAKHHKLQTEVFEANWELHGKSAGVIRNREMIDTVDGVMAFWDGSSPGTAHVIAYAIIKKKWLRVVNEKGQTTLAHEGEAPIAQQ